MSSPSHRAPRTPWRRRLTTTSVGVLVALGLVVPVSVGLVGPRLTSPEPEEPATLNAAAGEPSKAPKVRGADPGFVVERRAAMVSRAVARRELEAERLRREAERRAKAKAEARRKAREAARQPFSFRIGSFNVLGSQHTAPGGDRQGLPSASWRTPQAAGLIAKHGVDILGTQELQDDQLRGLQSLTGMAAYPGLQWGTAETDNSILYDSGVFEIVSASRFTIVFMGRARPQPIVRFRHRASGKEFYVVNTHPSAGGGVYASQRYAAQNTLVGIVNNLKATGLPVLVTGDMNDRETFYCRVVPPTGMLAPNGGSYSGGCQPPPSPLPVDWVVGSGVGWSGYWRDTTPVDRKISDHFFISAAARVG